ncbi:MAG TPA: protein-disulfide reductase DsbD domain-containing protein [Bryocella sp.]|nr:protein-disulfide reductase DsbD domain-containing protein [Bryocella sp.]
MKRRFIVKKVALIITAIAIPLVAAAQISLGGLDRTAQAKKQHVELLTDSLQLTANKPQDVELRFRVEPGFHINSHTPKDELLIPTVLKLDPGSLHIAGEQYPPGQHFRLQIGSGEDLDVYQGEFRVMLRVQAPKGATTLAGSLRYQACDTAACFPAKLLPVQIAVTAH